MQERFAAFQTEFEPHYDKLASAFNIIYPALKAGEELAPTFLADKQHLSSRELMLKLHERDHDDEAFAFELAQKHIDHCDESNTLLFWEIYKRAFSQAPIFKQSNILGITYFSSATLERDAGKLTEEQINIIQAKIRSLDLTTDHSRKARIVGSLSANKQRP
jgi:hypothetical protein